MDIISLLFPAGAFLTQRYGVNAEYYAKYGLRGHNGIDIARPRNLPWYAWHGTSVCCLTSGKATPGYSGGYGLYLYLYADDGDEWLYAHLAQLLNCGYVRAGDVIGRAGYTGNCEPPGGPGTHLHLGWRPRGYSVADGMRGYADPLIWANRAG